MAIAARNPPQGLIHHSDRGVQYACNEYAARLDRRGGCDSKCCAVRCRFDESMEAQHMATTKLSDEEFLAFLEKHPDLRDRFASIVSVVENSEGNLEEADTAEEPIIEEMRHLGREAMQGWAERQVEVTEQEIRQQPQMHRQGKKTPLAYETRRDRAPGAAISVGEKRAPVPAECESHSSRLFAGFAARDHRFCRRSTFRSGADEVAGALWLRDGREHDPEDRSGPRQEHLKRAG